MSIESAKKFIEKVKSDEDFKAKLSAIDSPEDRIAFAKKEGFDFSFEEMGKATSELSEDELDAVAGGVSVCRKTCFPYIGGKKDEVDIG